MPAARWHQRCHQHVAGPLHTHLHPTTAEGGPKRHIWQGTKHSRGFQLAGWELVKCPGSPLHATSISLQGCLPAMWSKNGAVKRKGWGKMPPPHNPFSSPHQSHAHQSQELGETEAVQRTCSVPFHHFPHFFSHLRMCQHGRGGMKTRSKGSNYVGGQGTPLHPPPSPVSCHTTQCLHPGQIQTGIFIWCRGRLCKSPSLHRQSSPAVSQSAIPELHLQVTWATASLLPIS